MKWYSFWLEKELEKSLPVRGAWIEILLRPQGNGLMPSLPVRGAWIEICFYPVFAFFKVRRSPCGERGLKCL